VKESLNRHYVLGSVILIAEFNNHLSLFHPLTKVFKHQQGRFRWNCQIYGKAESPPKMDKAEPLLFNEFIIEEFYSNLYALTVVVAIEPIAANLLYLTVID